MYVLPYYNMLKQSIYMQIKAQLAEAGLKSNDNMFKIAALKDLAPNKSLVDNLKALKKQLSLPKIKGITTKPGDDEITYLNALIDHCLYHLSGTESVANPKGIFKRIFKNMGSKDSTAPFSIGINATLIYCDYIMDKI
jgi:hypothetical protein|tara:strand:- start:88 stop:501 length:414 start_codon:yes stop_codon:yes gene_type:complete